MPERCDECGFDTISVYETFDGHAGIDHECKKCLKLCGEFVPAEGPHPPPPDYVRYCWNGKECTLDEFVGMAVDYKKLTDLFIRNVYALSRMRLRVCSEDELPNWQACAEWCEALVGIPSLLRDDPRTDSVSLPFEVGE